MPKQVSGRTENQYGVVPGSSRQALDQPSFAPPPYFKKSTAECECPKPKEGLAKAKSGCTLKKQVESTRNDALKMGVQILGKLIKLDFKGTLELESKLLGSMSDYCSIAAKYTEKHEYRTSPIFGKGKLYTSDQKVWSDASEKLHGLKSEVDNAIAGFDKISAETASKIASSVSEEYKKIQKEIIA